VTAPFQPTPTVRIGGRVADATLGSFLLSDGGDSDQVALAGLSVSWGTDEAVGQHDLATGRLLIFDRTKTWAVTTRLIGLQVRLGWTTGTDDGLFFRGRITEVKVTPRTAGGVDGSLVECRLVSVLADLANVIPVTSWAAQTYGNRRAAIDTAAGDVLATIDTGSALIDSWPMRAYAAADQVSVLRHLASLYESRGGLRYVWDPDTKNVAEVSRHHNAWRTLGALVSTPTGARIAAEDMTASGVGGGPASVTLDGSTTGYEPGDGIRLTGVQHVTEAQLTYPDAAAGTDVTLSQILIYRLGRDPEATGPRVGTLDSDVTANAQAQLALARFAEILDNEGMAWRMEPLTWRTADHGGGFPDEGTMRLLLAGTETVQPVFLTRSIFATLGLRPVVGVQGGVIAHDGDGWLFELNPAPVFTSSTQHAITPEEIDDGSPGNEVQWWDGDHPHGLHESLSIDDLRYVGLGVGVTSYPADTGWDEYQ
jgi:hypothetical protein